MPGPVSRTPTQGGVQKEIEDAKKQKAIDDANQAIVDFVHKLHGSGQHNGSPSTPSLNSIVLGTHDINFDDAPVGGWASLSLWPDGRYQFSGHLHDSGAPNYDYGVVWLLLGSRGTAFVFKRTGTLHGVLPGSRNDDWNDSNTNASIVNAWAELSASYHWTLSAEVNADIGALVDAATRAVGQVSKIVEIASA
jgi:hypothetical protein